MEAAGGEWIPLKESRPIRSSLMSDLLIEIPTGPSSSAPDLGGDFGVVGRIGRTELTGEGDESCLELDIKGVRYLGRAHSMCMGLLVSWGNGVGRIESASQTLFRVERKVEDGEKIATIVPNPPSEVGREDQREFNGISGEKEATKSGRTPKKRKKEEEVIVRSEMGELSGSLFDDNDNDDEDDDDDDDDDDGIDVDVIIPRGERRRSTRLKEKDPFSKTGKKSKNKKTKLMAEDLSDDSDSHDNEDDDAEEDEDEDDEEEEFVSSSSEEGDESDEEWTMGRR